MTNDELRTDQGWVRLTLPIGHGLQRFRLPGSVLHLHVLAGALRVSSTGTTTTCPAGSHRVIPAGRSVRLDPATSEVEIELWCAPPGPEHVLAVLADPATESTTRMAYAADGGLELLLDPMPM